MIRLRDVTTGPLTGRPSLLCRLWPKRSVRRSCTRAIAVAFVGMVICGTSTVAVAQDVDAAGAEELLAQKNYPAAEKAYRALIETTPADAELHDGLVRALQGQKRWQDAIDACKAGIAAAPDWDRGRYRLGYNYRKAGRFEEAAAAYEEYSKNHPDDPDAFYGLGVSHEKAGNARAAVAAYSRYIEVERRPSEARWVERAKEAMARLEKDGGDGEAEAAAPTEATPEPAETKAEDPPPKSGGVTPQELVAMGDRAYEEQDWNEAAGHYESAAKQAPDSDIEAWYKFGVAAAVAGRLEQAIDAWTVVVERRPEFSLAKTNIRRARARLRADTKTEEVGEEQLEEELAVIDELIAASRFEAALRRCDRLAGATSEDQANIRWRRGRAEMGLAAFDRAVAELSAAHRALPTDNLILGDLGLASALAGQQQRAKWLLHRFLDQADENGAAPASYPAHRAALQRLTNVSP